MTLPYPTSRPETADHLLNAGAALALCSLVHGRLHLFSAAYPPLLPNTLFGLAVACVLLGAGTTLSIRRRRLPVFAAEGWFTVLVLVLISDIPYRWPTHFHGGLGFPHLAGAAVLGALLLPRLGSRTGSVVWFAGVLGGIFGMAEAAQGGIVCSDDHPAFLYRLAQLKEQFPHIPFYNPMWNGGVEAREFFPSGMLNFFLLLSPLIASLDMTSHYNTLLAVLFFLIQPACTYLAAKTLKLDAPLAPVLALFTSVVWFRYQFIFGTLGFLTSTALAPLVLALLIRVAQDGEQASWGLVAGFIICTSLFILWTPAVFIAVPCALCLIRPLLHFFTTRKGMAAFLALLALNVPWLAIFLMSSQVLAFISTTQSGEAGAVGYPAFGSLFNDARYALRSAAPALVFLTIPGLLRMRHQTRAAFRVFAASIVLLFIAGVFLAPVKPRLELQRLTTVALYLCALPAGLALNVRDAFGPRRMLYGFGIGSVLLIPAVVYVFAANKTLERYSAFSPQLPGLIQAVRDHHGGGRIAFSGYIQHELDGGHVTALPLFTGIPLYASRYQHDRWDHEDFIPKQFRKEHDVGIEKFFDLYNISAVLVHDAEWQPWFSARPAYYTPVWREGKFTMFERRFAPRSWFLEGTGRLLQQQSGDLRLHLDAHNALVRFNWLPFLEVEGCKRIVPAEVYEGISFIRLEECSIGTEIVIRARPALQRLLEKISSVAAPAA